ncbi:MAG: hypothetical protein AAF651_14660 [Cyanobacteria bacterium P01_C01_bin.73]
MDSVCLPDPLRQSVEFIRRERSDAPDAAAVVAALQTLEKDRRRQRQSASLSDLFGVWQLGFITGTQSSRKAAGGLLGAGRFIPKWIGIKITYSPATDSDRIHSKGDGVSGRVNNTVSLGMIQLAVSGPINFLPQRSTLAFDFTQIKVSIGEKALYSAYLGDGQEREADFFGRSLKDQAFFTYFLITSDCVAARGKGGGLALWVRQNPV